MLVLLAACAPEPAPVDTATGPICAGTAPEILLASASIGCVDDRETLSAALAGRSGGGEVLVVRPADPAWTEVHDLARRSGDECGDDEVVGVDLATGAPFARDEATPLSCDDLPDLTAAFAVFAPLDPADPGDPVVADCLAVGADPEGLVAGAYDADLAWEPRFDWRACRIGLR
jgi:hypothetical protein